MAVAALPASPPGHRFLGHLPAFQRDPLDFLLQCARRYGDFVPLRFATRRAFFVNDPASIEKILVTDHRNFIKGPALRRSRCVFGNGLLTSEGDFWRRQRELAQPAFHRERIQAYSQVMSDCVKRRMTAWQEGQTCDIHAEMMQLTLQIAVRTLFGAELEAGWQVAQALEVAQDAFARWIHYVTLLPAWCPTPTMPGLTQAVRQLDAIVYQLIRSRRASGDDRGDLLSLLILAQDEDDGGQMSDKQLRDEALTLFLAGHETTALALTWAWYLLGQHPETEATLRAELRTVLNGRMPTFADLPSLKYTEQVIREAMRLYPPAWAIGRTALADYMLGAHTLPAGATVILSQYVMHRDHRFFTEPEAFRPERWADNFARTLPRFAYFPFGGGPRICIGNTFAMTEAVLLLAAIAQRWQMRLQPGQTVTPLPAMTLRPKQGVQVELCALG